MLDETTVGTQSETMATGDPALADPATGEASAGEGAASPEIDYQAELLSMKQMIEQTARENAELKEAHRKAEKALVEQKKKEKEIEMSNLSQEEQLKLRLEEFEKEKKAFRMDASRELAKGVFSAIGVTDKDLSDDDLNLFVTDDKDETLARVRWLQNFVSKREAAAAKLEREKVLKESPTPPAGSPSDEDEFIATLRNYA